MRCNYHKCVETPLRRGLLIWFVFDCFWRFVWRKFELRTRGHLGTSSLKFYFLPTHPQLSSFSIAILTYTYITDTYTPSTDTYFRRSPLRYFLLGSPRALCFRCLFVFGSEFHIHTLFVSRNCFKNFHRRSESIAKQIHDPEMITKILDWKLKRCVALAACAQALFLWNTWSDCLRIICAHEL